MRKSFLEVQLEPTNTGHFEATCKAGHEFKLSAAYHNFQILFEIGLHAICDGYYREAIGSFTACYERFLEFFVKLIVRAEGIETELLDNSWSKVSSQSERQLGAYIFLYLLTFKEVPPVLSQSKVKLRNSVIHKGLIPTRIDSLKYGDAVSTIVFQVLRRLWSSHKDQVEYSAVSRMYESEDYPHHTFFPSLALDTDKEPPSPGHQSSTEALVMAIQEKRNSD